MSEDSAGIARDYSFLIGSSVDTHRTGCKDFSRRLSLFRNMSHVIVIKSRSLLRLENNGNLIISKKHSWQGKILLFLSSHELVLQWYTVLVSMQSHTRRLFHREKVIWDNLVLEQYFKATFGDADNAPDTCQIKGS